MVPSSVRDKYVIRFCAVAQNCCEEDIDYAWEVIIDFAAELLEKDQADELTEILDRKKKETLAQKRSFFVRMVSDPKLYNPAISHTGTPKFSGEIISPTADGTPMIQTPANDSTSWISWPLAFLFANSDDGGPKIRFRHLDTTVRLAPNSRRNSATPSPENETNGTKSPKRSPVLLRKLKAATFQDTSFNGK